MAQVLLKDLFQKAYKEQGPWPRKRRKGNPKASTGFFRVRKKKCHGCKQGFVWQYIYAQNKERYQFSRTDLLKLKEEVLAMGMIWKITDREQARKSIKRTPYTMQELE